MGSKTFDGVWFVAYSHDHPPPHVHGRYAGVEVVVDMLPDRTVRESGRSDSVIPRNAKRSDIRHILAVAATHWVELIELWEKTHGAAPKR